MTSLAYLAGVFDGEGSIGMYAPFYFPRAVVTNANREVCEMFRNELGGMVYDRGVRFQSGKVRLRQWGWVAQGGAAKVALSEMLPFLVVKKSQALEALKVPIGSQGVRLGDEGWNYRRTIAARLKSMKRDYEVVK